MGQTYLQAYIKVQIFIPQNYHFTFKSIFLSLWLDYKCIYFWKEVCRLSVVVYERRKGKLLP